MPHLIITWRNLSLLISNSWRNFIVLFTWTTLLQELKMLTVHTTSTLNWNYAWPKQASIWASSTPILQNCEKGLPNTSSYCLEHYLRQNHCLSWITCLQKQLNDKFLEWHGMSQLIVSYLIFAILWRTLIWQGGMLWVSQQGSLILWAWSHQLQCGLSCYSNDSVKVKQAGMSHSQGYCLLNESPCFWIWSDVSLFWVPDIALELTVILSRATCCKDFVMPPKGPMQQLCIYEEKLKCTAHINASTRTFSV